MFSRNADDASLPKLRLNKIATVTFVLFIHRLDVVLVYYKRGLGVDTRFTRRHCRFLFCIVDANSIYTHIIKLYIPCRDTIMLDT